MDKKELIASTGRRLQLAGTKLIQAKQQLDNRHDYDWLYHNGNYIDRVAQCVDAAIKMIDEHMGKMTSRVLCESDIKASRAGRCAWKGCKNWTDTVWITNDQCIRRVLACSHRCAERHLEKIRDELENAGNGNNGPML